VFDTVYQLPDSENQIGFSEALRSAFVQKAADDANVPSDPPTGR
jgi:hypothetical protein